MEHIKRKRAAPVGRELAQHSGAQAGETVTASLNAQAQRPIEAGDFDATEGSLVGAGRKRAGALEGRALAAAKTFGLRGKAALARQRHGEAAENFAAAAAMLPPGHEDVAFAYLNAEADAFYREAARSGGREAFESAIASYRKLTVARPRDSFPDDWAMMQLRLGATLQTLGEFTGECGPLEDAAAAYCAALQELSRARTPQLWAMAQMSLGTALFRLGEKQPGTEKLNEAVSAYREALEEHSRERAPLDWARTSLNLGAALEALARRDDGTARLIEAIELYREALQDGIRRAPVLWAMIQISLGNALSLLCEREGKSERLREAANAYREALAALDADSAPVQWAAAQMYLGDVLLTLGKKREGRAELGEALSAYGAALQIICQRAHSPPGGGRCRQSGHGIVAYRRTAE
ncbi:MAG: hypothetical protein J2P49_03350 [Methylocapsa sp.]|nr:hypothetical protein [Methylocapsa sp.]